MSSHIERQYIDRRQRVHGDGKVQGDLTLVRTQWPHGMNHNQGGGDRVIPSSLGSQLPPGLAPHQISAIPSAPTRRNPRHGDGQATQVDGTGSEHLRVDYCVEFVRNQSNTFDDGAQQNQKMGPFGAEQNTANISAASPARSHQSGVPLHQAQGEAVTLPISNVEFLFTRPTRPLSLDG